MSSIANQYAKALLEVVNASGSEADPEAALQQLESFVEALKTSADLRTALYSPAVSVAQKRAVVAKIADLLGLGQTLRNFLFVVIQKRRVELIPLMREAFRARLDEQLGLVRAEIASAQELGDAERSAIETQLARTTGKQVRGHYAVDAALLGGVTAKLGSLVYDGSVRGQLDLLRRKLAASG